MVPRIFALFAAAPLLAACAETEERGGLAGETSAGLDAGRTGAGATGSRGGSGDGGSGSGSGEGGDATAAEAETGCEPFCRLDVESDYDVPGTECGGATLELEPIAPNVMFVLDRSGSMFTERWDHDANPATAEVRRWASVYDVATSVVVEFDPSMNLGATFFPSIGQSGCGVGSAPEVPVGPQQGGEIILTLPARESVDSSGATPASQGLLVGRDHLIALDPSIPRAIIYITDGAPSGGCRAENPFDSDSNGEVAATLERARLDHNIFTYVVGVDISNSLRSGFNQVAVAGGVPATGGADQFYNSKDEQQLSDALETIGDQIRSCEVVLDPAPDDPDRTRILIDEDTLDRVEDCASEDGWLFTAADRIELCGAACTRIKQTGGQIEAKYDCPPQG